MHSNNDENVFDCIIQHMFYVYVLPLPPSLLVYLSIIILTRGFPLQNASSQNIQNYRRLLQNYIRLLDLLFIYRDRNLLIKNSSRFGMVRYHLPWCYIMVANITNLFIWTNSFCPIEKKRFSKRSDSRKEEYIRPLRDG